MEIERKFVLPKFWFFDFSTLVICQLEKHEEIKNCSEKNFLQLKLLCFPLPHHSDCKTWKMVVTIHEILYLCFLQHPCRYWRWISFFFFFILYKLIFDIEPAPVLFFSSLVFGFWAIFRDKYPATSWKSPIQ